MNCAQFRRNISTTAQGQINEKWSGPTRMFMVNLRRTVVEKDVYKTEEIQGLLNQVRFMLEGRNPDRALLEFIQKDLEEHLKFLSDVDEILL